MQSFRQSSFVWASDESLKALRGLETAPSLLLLTLPWPVLPTLLEMLHIYTSKPTSFRETCRLIHAICQSLLETQEADFLPSAAHLDGLLKIQKRHLLAALFPPQK